MTEPFNRTWDKIGMDLGFNDCDMSRDRPHSGQPHTNSGERGATLIEGLTFRDLSDVFIRAVCTCGGSEALRAEADKGEKAALCQNDVYQCDDLDLMAVVQTMACEIEKLMGIYPNVPKLRVMTAQALIDMSDEEIAARRAHKGE